MRLSSIACLLLAAATGVAGENKTKGRRSTRRLGDNDSSTIQEGRALQFSLAKDRGGSGGGAARRGKGGGKGGGMSDVCRDAENDVVTITMRDDFCGATLGDGKKYVVQLDRSTMYLDCGADGGPTLEGDGTTLDCNGELVVGDIYMEMAGTGQVGITMAGDNQIVENCRVRSFSGDGFIMSSGDNMKLLNSYAEDVNRGLLVGDGVTGQVDIIKFQSFNTLRQGIRINADADTTIVSPRISNAGLGPPDADIGNSSGIRIDDGSDGDHLIIDAMIEMSENRAINIVGDGDTTVVGGKFTKNGGNAGINVAQDSAGNHILKNIETSDNDGHGVAYQGTGSITINNISAKDNDNSGIRHSGSGDIAVIGGELTKNGVDGFVSNAAATGAVTLENVDISDNGRDGVRLSGAHTTMITGGTIEENENHGINIADTNDGVAAVTITGVTIEKNKSAGIRQARLQTGSVTVDLSSSVVNENKDNGIMINENGQFNVECTSVVKNTGVGVLVPRGELNIVDSDVSETKDSMGMEGTNLQFTRRNGNPTITLDRVRVCDGDMVDVTDNQPVLAEMDLTTTTCDSIVTRNNPSSIECGFACDECEVDIPGWCLTPDSPYFDSTTCSGIPAPAPAPV